VSKTARCLCTKAPHLCALCTLLNAYRTYSNSDVRVHVMRKGMTLANSCTCVYVCVCGGGGGQGFCGDWGLTTGARGGGFFVSS